MCTKYLTKLNIFISLKLEVPTSSQANNCIPVGVMQDWNAALLTFSRSSCYTIRKWTITLRNKLLRHNTAFTLIPHMTWNKCIGVVQKPLKIPQNMPEHVEISLTFRQQLLFLSWHLLQFVWQQKCPWSHWLLDRMSQSQVSSCPSRQFRESQTETHLWGGTILKTHLHEIKKTTMRFQV